MDLRKSVLPDKGILLAGTSQRNNYVHFEVLYFIFCPLFIFLFWYILIFILHLIKKFILIYRRRTLGQWNWRSIDHRRSSWLFYANTTDFRRLFHKTINLSFLKDFLMMVCNYYFCMHLLNHAWQILKGNIIYIWYNLI